MVQGIEGQCSRQIGSILNSDLTVTGRGNLCYPQVCFTLTCESFITLVIYHWGISNIKKCK